MELAAAKQESIGDATPPVDSEEAEESKSFIQQENERAPASGGREEDNESINQPFWVCKPRCPTRIRLIYGISTAIIATFLICALLTWELTYGYEIWVLPFEILILVIHIGCFWGLLSLIHCLYDLYVTRCSCSKQDYSRLTVPNFWAFSSWSFCTFFIQVSMWYLFITIVLAVKHPYLHGPLNLQFPSDSDHHSKGISVRAWPQTNEYSATLYKPTSKEGIQTIINDVLAMPVGQRPNIRAVGSAHAWSRLLTNDIIVSLENINGIDIDLEVCFFICVFVVSYVVQKGFTNPLTPKI